MSSLQMHKQQFIIKQFIIIGDGAFSNAIHAMICRHHKMIVSNKLDQNVIQLGNNLYLSLRKLTIKIPAEASCTPPEAINIPAEASSHQHDNCIWLIPCVPAYALEDVLLATIHHLNIEHAHNNIPQEKDEKSAVIYKILLVSKGMSGDLTTCELMERMHLEYAVLAGPHFAQEVIKGLYTETSIACSDDDFYALNNIFINVKRFSSRKVLQFAGVIKNIIAYAAGFMHGSNAGKNAVACMITNTLLEFQILCHSIFPNEPHISIDEILSPGVMADIILCASSSDSRNFKYGYQKAHDEYPPTDVTVEALYSGKYLGKYISQKWPTISWAINCVSAKTCIDLEKYAIWNIINTDSVL
jgi:glycerol-3-phosphate dehydrogenase